MQSLQYAINVTTYLTGMCYQNFYNEIEDMFHDVCFV